MATIWPTDSDANFYLLHRPPRKQICEPAVDLYGLVTAQQALKDAESAGADVAAGGPFLLAWSPSTDKGKQNALVLVSDLSDVTTYEQAKGVFTGWTRKIELNPELWNKGWDIDQLRAEIRYWVDKYGTKTLMLFGLAGGP